MVKRLQVKRRKKVLPEFTQEIPVNGIITVGNDSSATVELKDENIAPEQFVIVCEDDSMTLLCRVEGTSVNGEKLPQGALHNLKSGDEITVKDFTITTGATETNGFSKAENIAIALPIEEETIISEIISPPPEKSERTLSDVLENLRSEEKFYFLIREVDGEDRRVYLESEEMRLGWSAAGKCVLSVEANEIAVLRAKIRKDWSGVVIYPQKKGDVWLNDETIAEPNRLKNDDRIFLLLKDSAKLSLETVIKFHEPTALLILDSILPKELPPPVLLDETAKDSGTKEIDETDLIHTSRIPPIISQAKRKIFGYFTVTEIIIMTIGTLITAATIFLVLELY